MNRDFKGIWIPREICLHPELSPLAMMVWANIHSLFCREKQGCYATNEYLASKFRVSESHISDTISNLKALGLIVEVSFNGRTRFLRAVVPAEDLETIESLPESREEKFHPYREKSLDKRRDTTPPTPITHITIPSEIWLRKDISVQAKCLWAEIRSLHDKEEGGCFASDEYLMEFIGLKRSRLHELYKELKESGLMKVVSFDGRRSVRCAVVPEVEYGGRKLSRNHKKNIPPNPQPPMAKDAPNGTRGNKS